MKLYFRYVYTFYRFSEEELSDVIEESFSLSEGCRFTLAHQEDGSFQVLSLSEDRCILVFPNKDQLVLIPGEENELAYDEFCEILGDPCHNVYEGTVLLTK